ncbi:MAG: co-chaperone GroES [Bacilli bacterium]|nr:co-chaperone GroES [Bacillales bacterium]MDY2574920.1 co-chaperone GroES [Bacilli bacterium]
MIKPLNGNLVLKKELKENKTASGIVLSQKKEEEDFAHVVALSEDEEVKKLGLKVGDKVMYKSYSETKVTYEGEEYFVLSYKDILAVLD